MFSEVLDTYTKVSAAGQAVDGAIEKAFNSLMQEAINGYFVTKDQWGDYVKGEEIKRCEVIGNVPRKTNGEYNLSRAPWNVKSTYKTAVSVIGSAITFGIPLTTDDEYGNSIPKGKSVLDKEIKEHKDGLKDPAVVLKGMLETAHKYATKHELGELLMYLDGEAV